MLSILALLALGQCTASGCPRPAPAISRPVVQALPVPAYAFAAPAACNGAACGAKGVSGVVVRRRGLLGWRRGR